MMLNETQLREQLNFKQMQLEHAQKSLKEFEEQLQSLLKIKAQELPIEVQLLQIQQALEAQYLYVCPFSLLFFSFSLFFFMFCLLIDGVSFWLSEESPTSRECCGRETGPGREFVCPQQRLFGTQYQRILQGSKRLFASL